MKVKAFIRAVFTGLLVAGTLTGLGFENFSAEWWIGCILGNSIMTFLNA